MCGNFYGLDLKCVYSISDPYPAGRKAENMKSKEDGIFGQLVVSAT